MFFIEEGWIDQLQTSDIDMSLWGLWRGAFFVEQAHMDNRYSYVLGLSHFL